MKSPAALTWRIAAFHVASCHRDDGRSLIVQVAGMEDDEYGVIAIEGATDAIHSVRALDDHGHKVVGTFATEAAAKRAGEAFAHRWRRSGKSVDACACKDIAPARVRRSARRVA